MPIYAGKFYPQGTQAPPPFSGGLRARGPVIQVQIEVPLALSKQLQASSIPIPQPLTGLALVDTGATSSAIDKQVPGKLGVSPIGTTKGSTASGPSTHNLYPIRIVWPGIMNMDFQAVIDADLAPQGLIALLGRDFLERAILVYDGPTGEFRLAF